MVNLITFNFVFSPFVTILRKHLLYGSVRESYSFFLLPLVCGWLTSPEIAEIHVQAGGLYIPSSVYSDGVTATSLLLQLLLHPIPCCGVAAKQ